MCNSTPDLRFPEERLADLIYREAGVKIDKHVIRMFIRANWSKVSALAHAIHEMERAR